MNWNVEVTEGVPNPSMISSSLIYNKTSRKVMLCLLLFIHFCNGDVTGVKERTSRIWGPGDLAGKAGSLCCITDAQWVTSLAQGDSQGVRSIKCEGDTSRVPEHLASRAIPSDYKNFHLE